ncbi:unnamed protein product [Amoebophrya sp. A120]|nr:unnamed protein product [Amoebophrya sp. A120]|eukprot:GSA120T00015944001.1
MAGRARFFHSGARVAGLLFTTALLGSVPPAVATAKNLLLAKQQVKRLAVGARVGTAAGKNGHNFRKKRRRSVLRICNAYPYAKPMNVFLNDVELYGGMEYKECEDFVDLNLLPGDTIRFKTEVDHHQHSAGIFEIADLPNEKATTLLLVITRHDTHSNAVAFQSHVFQHDPKHAQVAVIDAYRGTNPARVQIMHENAVYSPSASVEQLPIGRVNKINGGMFDLILDDGSSTQKETAVDAPPTPDDNQLYKFVALPGHDYVVLRTGIEDEKEEDDGAQEDEAAGADNPVPGDVSFPEELVVFPLSDPNRLLMGEHGGYWFLDTKFVLLMFVLMILAYKVFKPDEKSGQSIFNQGVNSMTTGVQVGAAGLLTRVAGDQVNSPTNSNHG